MDDQESLFKRVLHLTGQDRRDLAMLEGFDQDMADTIEGPIHLFWEASDPAKIERVKELPPLPDDIEDAVLEKLANIERSKRIQYDPEADYNKFLFNFDASTYLHVAAARVFRLKRRVGYSDDVRQILEETLRVLRSYDNIDPSDANLDYSVAGFLASWWAVVGLVLVELSRIRCLDGKYEEGLSLLAGGIKNIAIAVYQVQIPPEQLKEELYGSECPEELQEDLFLRGMVKEGLSNFDSCPQYAKDMFEAIRSRGKCEDWKGVAKSCEGLAEFGSLCGRDDTEAVKEGQGKELIWMHYWYKAQGWAEAQLSPNQFSEYLREEEDERATKRLTVYFFSSELWLSLPDRARQGFVNADRLWFSNRLGRIGACLNEMQIALETLCYSLIWQPLLDGKGNQNYLPFIKIVEQLRDERRAPTLANYAWICRQPFFREYVSNLNLKDSEKSFLTKDFTSALDELCRARNKDQHDAKLPLLKQEIDGLMRKFLGIGCSGVLTQFIEIMSRISPGDQNRHKGSK